MSPRVFPVLSAILLTVATAFSQQSDSKKSYQPVSRILFPFNYAQRMVWRVAIIYLAPALLQGSSCLPSGIGRAALGRRYTWHFSMQGLPAPAVTRRRRGLLPHVFILTARLAPGGSYFLWHYL